MNQIEIHKRINQIVKIFNGLGMWQDENKFTSFRTTTWKLLYLMFFMSFPISVISGGLVSANQDESIFLCCAGIVLSVNAVKLSYILWKKKEICAFIHDIGWHYVEDYKELIKVNEKVKNLMQFSTFFYLVVFLNFVGLSTFYLPVFSRVKRLPFNIWCPFDWKNNEIIYWLTYVYVVSGMGISGIAMLLNVVMWYLMTNCAIKYQILGSQFRNMFPMKSTIKNKKVSKVDDNLFLQKLANVIETHRNTQTTIRRFKSCFSTLFFVQITTSGICICSSVYALTFGGQNNNLLQYLIYASVALYNVFDIFMVMYFGNEISFSSDRLSYWLFQSNWLDQSKSCKKNIIVLTEILRKPHEFVIGKLYPLNLTTFTSIVKFAYSMFNILQNLT